MILDRVMELGNRLGYGMVNTYHYGTTGKREWCVELTRHYGPAGISFETSGRIGPGSLREAGVSARGTTFEDALIKLEEKLEWLIRTRIHGDTEVLTKKGS